MAVHEIARRAADSGVHLPPDATVTVRSMPPIPDPHGPGAHDTIAGMAEPWKAQPHLIELAHKEAAAGDSGRRTVLLLILALVCLGLLIYKRHEDREQQSAAVARQSAGPTRAAALGPTAAAVSEHLAAPTPAPAARLPSIVEEPPFEPPARKGAPGAADELLRAGIGKARAGDWEDARLDVQHAIELAPQSAVAHYWRGVILEGEKEYGKAAGELRRAMELAPAEGHAYRELANLYAHAGQHEKAIEILEGLIERLPGWEHGFAYQARGLSYRALKREPRAVEDLKLACKLGTQSACSQVTAR